MAMSMRKRERPPRPRRAGATASRVTTGLSDPVEAIVAENIRERSREVERARALAREKAAEFSAWEGSLAEGAEASLRHRRRPAEALE